MKYYTGIGSRKTPQSILSVMIKLAIKLEAEGWTVRTGDAQGADNAFKSATKKHEVYTASHCTSESMRIAQAYHPRWESCSEYARKLHGRSAFQVLGFELNKPSSFLICWTPDGCTNHKERNIKTGGTGTAISIADANKIEVLNLCIKQHIDRVIAYIMK